VRVEIGCKYARAGVLSIAALTGFLGPQFIHDVPRRVQAQTVTQALQPRVIIPVEKSAFPSGYNFALASNGAKVTGGHDPAQLIDGNDTNYTGGTGFATTQWKSEPPQPFIVTLKESVTLDYIRLLLWDRSEDRYYRYKLEVSADESGKSWFMVSDRSGPVDQSKSWQTLKFKAQPVKQIRLTGTFNSANSGFHVVELQAFFGTPPSAPMIAPDTLDF
jgi:hypothetical protein